MSQDIEHKIIAILKILEKENQPVGANFIASQLSRYGINLSERGVRYHLRVMDEKGLTSGYGKQGRMITQAGREELGNALVQDKVGFVRSKIDALAYAATFGTEKKGGSVVLNTSLISVEHFKQALNVMEQVFQARLCTSSLVRVGYPGKKIGELEIPEGKVGFGTVCSVTIDSILLKVGIPVEPRFAGIVQVSDEKPIRFTEIITYEGSSLDPLEILIASGMTSVTEAAQTGKGKILGGFREIPAASYEKAEQVLREADDLGIDGVLALGSPSQSVLGLGVGIGRAGFVVAGGLNPLATLREKNISSDNKAMSTLVEFSELESFEDLRKKYR